MTATSATTRAKPDQTECSFQRIPPYHSLRWSEFRQTKRRHPCRIQASMPNAQPRFVALSSVVTSFLLPRTAQSCEPHLDRRGQPTSRPWEPGSTPCKEWPSLASRSRLASFKAIRGSEVDLLPHLEDKGTSLRVSVGCPPPCDEAGRGFLTTIDRDSAPSQSAGSLPLWPALGLTYG